MGTIARLRKSARPLARFGCVSIGTVYVLVGVLALLALSGRWTGSADEDRMVHVLMQVPGGAVLIWGVIVGMTGYVFWRLVEVVADPYEFGTDWRGLGQRAGIGLTAAGYGLLAFSAGRIALSGGSAGNGETAEQEQQLLVSQVLDWPAGAWLVGAAGLAVLISGLVQFGLVYRQAYSLEILLEERSRGTRRLIHFLAGYGYAARGVILGVLGYFLLNAAVRRDPTAAGDTDTAFDFIGGGWVGDTAFFVVAVGTVAYGIFMYTCAAFYQFRKRPSMSRG
jgi:hypothetical protein